MHIRSAKAEASVRNWHDDTMWFLQELKPGAPQRSWVQSQTTFATLAKDEEGHWMPRVIKQKIWVDGTSYELQEIYGIENSSAGRSSDTEKQVSV